MFQEESGTQHGKNKNKEVRLNMHMACKARSSTAVKQVSGWVSYVLSMSILLFLVSVIDHKTCVPMIRIYFILPWSSLYAYLLPPTYFFFFAPPLIPPSVPWPCQVEPDLLGNTVGTGCRVAPAMLSRGP